VRGRSCLAQKVSLRETFFGVHASKPAGFTAWNR
jgi:hypothetical protein